MEPSKAGVSSELSTTEEFITYIENQLNIGQLVKENDAPVAPSQLRVSINRVQSINERLGRINNELEQL